MLIVIAVVPWIGYQNHSHWQRIGWVPFLSAEVRLRDIAINLLLYAPWGYFCVRSVRSVERRVWLVAALAAAVSITTEASQVYSHGRFPSATDVTCNVIGALAGALYARRSSMNYDR
jgi:glycopeptide antibiotics resistance protein